MILTIRNIQYHPDTGDVAILVEHDFGQTFINTTEAALNALRPDGGNWGNDEALQAAQLGVNDPAQQPKLAEKGYIVVLPEVSVAVPAAAPPLPRVG